MIGLKHNQKKYNELKQTFFDKVNLENLAKWDVVLEDVL